jgi:hypothetical protein
MVPDSHSPPQCHAWCCRCQIYQDQQKRQEQSKKTFVAPSPSTFFSSPTRHTTSACAIHNFPLWAHERITPFLKSPNQYIMQKRGEDVTSVGGTSWGVAANRWSWLLRDAAWLCRVLCQIDLEWGNCRANAGVPQRLPKLWPRYEDEGEGSHVLECSEIVGDLRF